MGEKLFYSMCGKRNLWTVCTFALSDRTLRCPFEATIDSWLSKEEESKTPAIINRRICWSMSSLIEGFKTQVFWQLISKVVRLHKMRLQRAVIRCFAVKFANVVIHHVNKSMEWTLKKTYIIYEKVGVNRGRKFLWLKTEIVGTL